MHTATRLVLAVLIASPAAFAGQADPLRDAVALGRTHDDALFESFKKSYELAPSGPIDRAEIVTEFRRAVLIVREHTAMGDYTWGVDALAKALAPFKGLVTFVVQVRLPPQNTLIMEPAYDLYVRTGSSPGSIASAGVKRAPVYPPGGVLGSPLVAVRLEASFQRADFKRSAMPELIVADEKAAILWQARVDLTRYR